jgi:hypothetical protein
VLDPRSAGRARGALDGRGQGQLGAGVDLHAPVIGRIGPTLEATFSGNLADRRFTLTFHGDDGILGVADRDRAHIFANLPGVSSYGVLPNLQLNSTGALNTVSRSAPGTYQVRLRGLFVAGGHVQVTAVSPALGSPRCKVAGWGFGSGPDQLVNVRCFDSSGFPADAQYVMSYVV